MSRSKLLVLLLISLTIIVPLTIVALRMPATAPAPKSDLPSTKKDQVVEEPSFDKQKFSTSSPDSIWVIVNKERPLNPIRFAPEDLVNVGGGQQLRKEAADSFAKMLAAAKTEKLTIQPLSGYRSYSRQEVVYKNEVAKNGQETADRQSAKPGYSEHQTGLAIDVGGGGCGIEDCFGNTKEGLWVAANAHKFGFVIRYPQNKEAVTGYRYEPWHIRYVGTELSSELYNKGVVTLEEFFAE